MVIGTESPVLGVLYDAESATGFDSGYTVLWDDAPHADELHVDGVLFSHPAVSHWCLHCLIEEHPEIGRGLDLAKEHGQVDWDDDLGEWVITNERTEQ